MANAGTLIDMKNVDGVNIQTIQDSAIYNVGGVDYTGAAIGAILANQFPAGVTATAAQINKLAAVTPGTVAASKALVVDAQKTLNELTVTALTTGATVTIGTIPLVALTVAVTANSTTTALAAGTYAITSNATGLGKLFYSDGSKWQVAA